MNLISKVAGSVAFLITLFNVITTQAQTVKVTFRLDMSDLYAETIFLGSDWAGWDPAKFEEMHDDDHDRVFELTVDLPVGHSYNYRSKTGERDWNNFEDLSSGTCGSGPAKQDRNIVVPNVDTILPIYCFSSCNDCASSEKRYLNLSVDMHNETISPNGVHVMGTFNQWSPTAMQMEDADEDNIYTASVRVYSSPMTYEYKFLNGNAYGTEELVFGTCEFRSNRIAKITDASLTQPTALFNYCDAEGKPLEAIKIGCIGNSITHGFGTSDMFTKCWPFQLRDLLGEGHYAENLGVSGRTMMKSGDFPWWNEPQFSYTFELQPDIIIIKLGTNDSKTYQWNAANYKKDYLSLIDTLRTMASHPQIYMSTPSKAYSAIYNISDSNIKNAIIPILKQIAFEKGVSLIDMYSTTSNMSPNFPDGVHPNDKGAGVIAKKVKEILLAQRPTISITEDVLNASAGNYQWYLNGEIIAGANSSFIEGTQDGVYTAAVKTSTNFNDILISDPFTLTLSETGSTTVKLKIDGSDLISGTDNDQGRIQTIYPNPSSKFLTIENFENYDADIKSLVGCSVHHVKKLNATETIDVSGMQKGIYLIYFHKANDCQVKRLVIN